jgi:hypothetical protein
MVTLITKGILDSLELLRFRDKGGIRMRKITYRYVVFAWLLLVGSFVAYAGEGRGVPYSGSKEYERMRQLVGVWEGTSNMGKEGQPVKVEYRLTAGGSAIVETLFPGTPEEMISVYYDRRGKLSMTHYCMLQNQPVMKLQSAGAEKLDFVFTRGNGIDPKRDPHMHALTISFVDKDHIVENWTLFEAGKLKEVTKLNLSRVR